MLKISGKKGSWLCFSVPASCRVEQVSVVVCIFVDVLGFVYLFVCRCF